MADYVIEHERLIVATAAFENAWDAALADYDPKTTSPDAFFLAAMRSAFLAAGIKVAEPGGSDHG